jgi:hypothetical protein
MTIPSISHLADLARAVEARKPGPWRATPCFAADADGCWCAVVDQGPDDKVGVIPAGCVDSVIGTYLAACDPTTILSLIGEIESLRGQVEILTSSGLNPRGVEAHVFKRMHEVELAVGVQSIGEVLPAILSLVERVQRAEAALPADPTRLPAGIFGEYARLDHMWQQHVLKIDAQAARISQLEAALVEALDRWEGWDVGCNRDRKSDRIAELRAIAEGKP